MRSGSLVLSEEVEDHGHGQAATSMGSRESKDGSVHRLSFPLFLIGFRLLQNLLLLGRIHRVAVTSEVLLGFLTVIQTRRRAKDRITGG